ncbi:oxygenase MpaB family protein [Corallococcus sp. AB038B]|uniref:oxygenase MpaB family protein n=1 Tax=Corallococcus sp. AB038B TaxID=2316718 RepID=UPI000EEAFE3D|nr:oxygenase MpaB family protein [Corallococcus sp. AB038B]RKI03471.1 DUF2236 domain-containing protein [Corallococcus sp. AB038B]
MPFIFRGQNLDAILGDPLNAANSLFSIMNAAEPELLQGLRTHWTKHVSTVTAFQGWRPALKAFSDITGFWGNTYSDHRLAKVLYDHDATATAAVTGAQSAAQFLRDFEAARDEAFYVFFQATSVNQLAGVSFKATYYHKDVSALFEQRRHSKIKAVVSRRVIETAQIMLRILYGNMNMGWGSIYSTRTLATTLLLAQMHNVALSHYQSHHTGRDRCYNQSAVAFTLLTFSHVVAQAWVNKGYEYNEQRWYSFWKLLGSLLGVDTRLMADDHTEAATLWNLFFARGECFGGPSAPAPTVMDPDRIDDELWNGYSVQPEANLLQWVPAFIVTQLRNSLRWGKYLTGL